MDPLFSACLINKDTDSLLFWSIFSRLFVWQTALEDRACLSPEWRVGSFTGQYIKDNGPSGAKVGEVCLQLIIKDLGFLKL